MQVRNTLVAVRLDLPAERKVGSIVISTNSDEFAEGVVVSVGPGTIAAHGGRSETHDLHVGDRVLVKRQEVRQQGNAMMKRSTGTEYKDGENDITIFTEQYIVGILSSSHIGTMPKFSGRAYPVDEFGGEFAISPK